MESQGPVETLSRCGFSRRSAVADWKLHVRHARKAMPNRAGRFLKEISVGRRPAASCSLSTSTVQGQAGLLISKTPGEASIDSPATEEEHQCDVPGCQSGVRRPIRRRRLPAIGREVTSLNASSNASLASQPVALRVFLFTRPLVRVS